MSVAVLPVTALLRLRHVLVFNMSAYEQNMCIHMNEFINRTRRSQEYSKFMIGARRGQEEPGG